MNFKFKSYSGFKTALQKNKQTSQQQYAQNTIFIFDLNADKINP